MAWVVLVIVLVLIEFFVLLSMVGRARGRYGITAPATTGHEIFERHFRVQQNTMEQLLLFLPSIWLFATFISPMGCRAGRSVPVGTCDLCGDVRARAEEPQSGFPALDATQHGLGARRSGRRRSRRHCHGERGVDRSAAVALLEFLAAAAEARVVAA
jgi:hypothetical protein